MVASELRSKLIFTRLDPSAFPATKRGDRLYYQKISLSLFCVGGTIWWGTYKSKKPSELSEGSKKAEAAFDFPVHKLSHSYIRYFVFLLLPDFSILFSTKNTTNVWAGGAPRGLIFKFELSPRDAESLIGFYSQRTEEARPLSRNEKYRSPHFA